MATMLAQLMTALRQRQEGQGMVEYALILALVSVVSIAMLTTMGTDVSAIFTAVNTALEAVPA